MRKILSGIVFGGLLSLSVVGTTAGMTCEENPDCDETIEWNDPIIYVPDEEHQPVDDWCIEDCDPLLPIELVVVEEPTFVTPEGVYLL